MRTVDTLVTTSGSGTGRTPTGQVIIRDTRIRFVNGAGESAYWIQVPNMFSAADTSTVLNEKFVFGDSISVGDHVFRAAYDHAGAVYTLHVSDPSDSSHWGAWIDSGIDCDTYGNPGLYVDGTTIYIYYMRAGEIRQRSTSDYGANWTAEVSTGVNVSGYVTLAPISNTVVYACTTIANSIRFYRGSYAGGNWSSAELPWRHYGSNTQPVTGNSLSSSSYFDTFQIGDTEFLIYTHGVAGISYQAEYNEGVFSAPQRILPDTDGSFLAYRVTVINGVAWLTGRVIRNLQDPNSVIAPCIIEFDTYMRSINGREWSVMARNSFLTSNEIRGKLLAVGSYLYYCGILSVYRAEIPYGVTTLDPEDKKLTIQADIISGQANFPSSGTSPQVDLELAAGDNKYIIGDETDILKRGSELWFYAGYKTSGRTALAMLDHAGIDTVRRGIANGQRTVAITARDIAFKAMRSWTSLLYWEFVSQSKNFGLDNLDAADGTGGWHGGDGGIIPGTGIDPGQDLVYAVSTSNFRKSINFTANSPNWPDKTGAITGTIIDFILDPWDTPEHSHNGTVLEVVYAITTTGIWKTVNAKAAYPNWSCVFDNSGGAWSFKNIRATIVLQDLVYALAVSGGRAYVLRTFDGGTTWSQTLVGTVAAYDDLLGLAVSQHNAGTLVAACAGTVYKSTDYAASFVAMDSLDTCGPTNLEMPYENNGSDSLILAGGGITTVPGIVISHYSIGDGWDHDPGVWTGPMSGYVERSNYTRDHGCHYTFSTEGFPDSGNIEVNITWTDEDNPYYILDFKGVTNDGGQVRGKGGTESRTLTYTSNPSNLLTIAFSNWSGPNSMSVNYIKVNGQYYYLPVTSSYIRKSTNGGSSFDDITPPQGGAYTWRSLHSDVLDSNHLTALAGTNDANLTLVVSSDCGENWESRNHTGAFRAIGRWPFNSHTIYLMDDTHIYWSDDDGVTLVDKTGDWSGLSGARNVIPCYLGE